jgi:hydroxymethylglutaryl-CoA reductase
MNLIKNDSTMKLEIIATGSHYSSDHGNTYKEIELDGFKIDHKVEILESFVDEIGTATAMAKAQVEITKILKNLKSAKIHSKQLFHRHQVPTMD